MRRKLRKGGEGELDNTNEEATQRALDETYVMSNTRGKWRKWRQPR